MMNLFVKADIEIQMKNKCMNTKGGKVEWESKSSVLGRVKKS